MGREFRWEDLRRFWGLRRELLKASITVRGRYRRTSRSLKDSLKLAALAREGFKTYLKVVRNCREERVLRLRR